MSLHLNRVVCIFSTTLMLLVAEQAMAVPIALYTAGGGTDRTGQNFSLGSTFTVGSKNAIVSALGVYDATGTALAFSTPVEIWDSSGTPVASATVNSGTTDTNHFSYASISPVTLTAGQTYTIAAFYSTSNTAHLLDHDGSPGTSTNFNSYGARYSNTTGSLNWTTVTTTGTAYIGPNLLFTVPEPATLSLVSGGLLLLVGGLSLKQRRLMELESFN
jgi:hypothetical protein